MAGNHDEATSGWPRLEGLYAAHIDGAVRIAYLMIGDKEKAQDLAHDAFVKIAGRFHDLRHRDAFSAYLRTTVLNLCRSHLRRIRVQRTYMQKEATRAVNHPTQPDVEERDLMRRALRQLPYRKRAALVLRYYEDLTEKQTAEVLGCSPAAVKALVRRGLQTLRETMQEEL